MAECSVCKEYVSHKETIRFLGKHLCNSCIDDYIASSLRKARNSYYLVWVFTFVFIIVSSLSGIYALNAINTIPDNTEIIGGILTLCFIVIFLATSSIIGILISVCLMRMLNKINGKQKNAYLLPIGFFLPFLLLIISTKHLLAIDRNIFKKENFHIERDEYAGGYRVIKDTTNRRNPFSLAIWLFVIATSIWSFFITCRILHLFLFP